MGMYTCVNASIPLNKTGRDVQWTLNKMHAAKQANDPSAWSTLAWPWAKEFGQDERADYIPFGGGGFLPEIWGDTPFNFVEDDRWVMLSTLKNYSCTIQKFAKLILPNITDTPESVQYLIWYEQAANPEQYVWNPKEKAFENQGTLEINIQPPHPFGE
jgi:hypothetical protein